MKHVPVMIVGAGPTGLMMACELARHGVSFRIIDKNKEPSTGTNATWIQTRTIEIFDQMGIADQLIRMSNPCHAINFYLEGKSLVKLPLHEIDSAYPFILMLRQSETEKLLNKRLEELYGKVERALELIDVKQSGDTVISTIRYADGHIEIVYSDWLLACDGANSTVRNQCEIFFPGKDVQEQFIVADAQIESLMSKDEVHLFFDEGSVFAAFPLSEHNHYRITANLHLEHKRSFFTEREIIEMTQERAHGDFYVKNVSWISQFWIHSKIVKHMQDGLIFLLGDAAHIHSPAGGQGMNTGIQDAYNLAWKLALVIKGKAKPSLLKSYHKERYPVVKEIVKQTERYTNMALFDTAFFKTLRNFAKNIKQDTKPLTKKIAMQLTQLNIQYQKSPVIDYDNVSGESIQQGTRIGDVKIHSSSRLYDYLRNTKHHAFLFAGPLQDQNALKKILELQKLLNKNYFGVMDAHVVLQEKAADIENLIFDPNGILHEHFKVKHPAIYVIRPDQYIAYCSKNLDFVLVKKFLKKYLM